MKVPLLLVGLTQFATRCSAINWQCNANNGWLVDEDNACRADSFNANCSTLYNYLIFLTIVLSTKLKYDKLTKTWQ